MINILEEIIKSEKREERILISTHENPDGDGIGSALALFLALNQLNKDNQLVVRLIIQDEVPSFLKFLNHSFVIEKKSNMITKYEFDKAIILDSGDLARIGNVSELISEKTKIINIDHHISNTKFGDINIVNDKLSSTAELLYGIIKEWNIDINTDIASAIYCGIINDTGNFAHGHITPSTFKTAAKLLETGIIVEEITQNLYNSKSYARIKILGEALANMKYHEEQKMVSYFLTQDTIKKYGGVKEDTEGIVESLRSYEKCDVSLFMREEADGKIKGSFRSKGKDVNRIAGLFGGGGHIKASGFKSDLTKDEILDKIFKNF